MSISKVLLAFSLLCSFVISGISLDAVVHYPGAEGFGAEALGGIGGKELIVTSLEDKVNNPPVGTLRWALNQKGPRIVKFAVAGTIALKGRLTVKEPFLTIDGYDAPGKGICIRDYPLEFSDTNDIVIRYIRLRRGDVSVLAELELSGRERPKNSDGLDCLELSDCKDVLIDHCSFSWSCDELISIVRCKDITVQWCLLAEPLGNPRLHPYGDNHAFCSNNSASRLSIHHCLFAHYVMRGPQFEANDVDDGIEYNIKKEAINNVLFDYTKSGSRYTTGIESNPAEAKGTKFFFQFINNYYIGKDSDPEIDAETKWGVIDDLQVYVKGNIGPHRPDESVKDKALVFVDDKPISKASSKVRDQISNSQLFSPTIPVVTEDPSQAYQRLLDEAGCSKERDAVDVRIINDVVNRSFTGEISSQNQVGGWPGLS